MQTVTYPNSQSLESYLMLKMVEVRPTGLSIKFSKEVPIWIHRADSMLPRLMLRDSLIQFKRKTCIIMMVLSLPQAVLRSSNGLFWITFKTSLLNNWRHSPTSGRETSTLLEVMVMQEYLNLLMEEPFTTVRLSLWLPPWHLPCFQSEWLSSNEVHIQDLTHSLYNFYILICFYTTLFAKSY